MDPRNLASTDLLAELLSSDGLNEVLAVLIAIAVAVIAGRIVRASFKRRLQNPAEGLSARLIETLVIAAPTSSRRVRQRLHSPSFAATA